MRAYILADVDSYVCCARKHGVYVFMYVCMRAQYVRIYVCFACVHGVFVFVHASFRIFNNKLE